MMDSNIVCVCVRERERDRERENSLQQREIKKENEIET